MHEEEKTPQPVDMIIETVADDDRYMAYFDVNGSC